MDYLFAINYRVADETCIVDQNMVVFCCQKLLKICFWTCQ